MFSVIDFLWLLLYFHRYLKCYFITIIDFETIVLYFLDHIFQAYIYIAQTTIIITAEAHSVRIKVLSCAAVSASTIQAPLS